MCRWQWAMEPENRRFWQRELLRRQWRVQRRLRALRDPDAELEHPDTAEAAGFCIVPATFEQQQDSAEGSDEQEPVMAPWGEDPSDWTDSEV